METTKKGMREDELRAHATCEICRKKLGQTGMPIFWRLKIERHGLLQAPLLRQQGLGMQIGGRLAAVMGPE